MRTISGHMPLIVLVVSRNQKGYIWESAGTIQSMLKRYVAFERIGLQGSQNEENETMRK